MFISLLDGGASGKAHVRKGKMLPKSEGKSVKNGPVSTEVRGGGAVPGTWAEIPLQPLDRPYWRRYFPAARGRAQAAADTNTAAHGGPCTIAGGYSLKEDAALGDEPMLEEFLGNCSPWEGLYNGAGLSWRTVACGRTVARGRTPTGPGAKCEEKGVAEELTWTDHNPQCPFPITLHHSGQNEEVKELGRKEWSWTWEKGEWSGWEGENYFSFVLVSHHSTLLLIGKK